MQTCATSQGGHRTQRGYGTPFGLVCQVIPPRYHRPVTFSRGGGSSHLCPHDPAGVCVHKVQSVKVHVAGAALLPKPSEARVERLGYHSLQAHRVQGRAARRLRGWPWTAGFRDIWGVSGRFGAFQGDLRRCRD
eukprot:1179143-Prorocentrum_minimum.AAC.1